MAGHVPEEIRARLYEVAHDRDGDLAEGALLIAAEEYPDLAMHRYLDFIDETAEAAARAMRARGESGPRDALVAEIFGVRRFAGDAENYYDPRNSYLSDVIDRRLGIPITLAIFYLSAARRLDEPVAGINAPGHFLVRHGDVMLDVFEGGRVVPRAALLRQLASSKVRDPDGFADRLLGEPPSSRDVLTRVLSNLKMNYLRAGDLERTLSALERLVQMNADQPLWLRERAAVYQRLDCRHAAIADLERYMELAPDDDEADVVHASLVELVRSAPILH